jgi:hypothetical protein
MLRFLFGLFAILIILYAVVWRGKPAIETLTPLEISTLLKRANEFDGQRVTVGGIVLDSAAVMGLGGFRLRQGDAEVLVLTSRGIPESRSEVRVSGTFKQAFVLNGVQYAVILAH